MMQIKKLLVFILCVPFLIGCWDSIEVEERGFVTGIAIDIADDKNSNTLQHDEQLTNLQKDEDKHQQENNAYTLTQQLLNPSSVGTQQNGGGQASTKSAFRNLSQTGDTIIEMNRDMVRQAGRRTNVTHLNVVIFSEAIAKKEHAFSDLMDIFLREKEMLRSVKIAIVQDHAGDYLSILPENEQIPSKYISKVLENKSSLNIAQPITVGQVQSHLLSKNSFVIPYINKLNDTTVNYEGLAIYNGIQNKVVGILTGDHAKGLNIIQAQNQTGTLNVKVDKHDVTFEILKVKSKITLKHKQPLVFHIAIDVEAGVAEQFGSLDIMEEKNYKKLQKALQQSIKQTVQQTVSVLQNDFQSDVIGFNHQLQRKDYSLWQSIGKQWENGQFQNSKVEVVVNGTIEKPGNIIKSH